LEEFGRRTRAASPTAGWRTAKAADVKAIDDILNKTSKTRLLELVGDLRKNRPDLFRFLRSDPVESDLGRSLIYTALKNSP